MEADERINRGLGELGPDVAVVDRHGKAVGTVSTSYLCRCGEFVPGNHALRGWARCVICERVVDRRRMGGLGEGVGVVMVGNRGLKRGR